MKILVVMIQSRIPLRKYRIIEWFSSGGKAEGILVDCERQKSKVTWRVIEIFAGSKRLKFTR